MNTIETLQGKTQPDPRVQAVIGHWAPRFVTNGKLDQAAFPALHHIIMKEES